MEENYLERIKKLKSEKKITNEQLSRMTGIPLGTLSKFLAGISDSVKLSNIIAVCNALDCSLDYIISGQPENTNNYTLEDGEIKLIEDYRRLDSYGKELVLLVLGKEAERISRSAYTGAAASDGAFIRNRTTVRRRYGEATGALGGKREIPLYDLLVSAGIGEYLDGDSAESITIPRDRKTDGADFALRISGNSMEPKYHNGDVLLVESCDAVEVGEPCVYILDGNGYFKIFGGDCLISLNPEYGRILLKDFTEISCAGRARSLEKALTTYRGINI